MTQSSNRFVTDRAAALMTRARVRGGPTDRDGL